MKLRRDDILLTVLCTAIGLAAGSLVSIAWSFKQLITLLEEVGR